MRSQTSARRSAKPTREAIIAAGGRAALHFAERHRCERSSLALVQRGPCRNSAGWISSSTNAAVRPPPPTRPTLRSATSPARVSGSGSSLVSLDGAFLCNAGPAGRISRAGVRARSSTSAALPGPPRARKAPAARRSLSQKPGLPELTARARDGSRAPHTQSPSTASFPGTIDNPCAGGAKVQPERPAHRQQLPTAGRGGPPRGKKSPEDVAKPPVRVFCGGPGRPPTNHRPQFRATSAAAGLHGMSEKGNIGPLGKFSRARSVRLCIPAGRSPAPVREALRGLC
jgi:hypothetical protein